MTELCQAQRAMRRMRKAAVERGALAVLDVGTSKVACLILRFDRPAHGRDDAGTGPLGGRIGARVIGAATTRSRGVRFGEIAAMAETERAIRTVVQAAQKMADTRVDHAIACLSGASPYSCGLDGQVTPANGTVTEHDVARALAACNVPDTDPDREILHAQPIHFAVDHRTGLADPRGQSGATLCADMHLVSVDSTAIRNLLHAVKRADLELAGLASSAYVAGLASLVEDEQELGAACIDLGGGTTGLSIFFRKAMIYADSVRMGGDHVTSDISKGLKVPPATAERIKTFHGGVMATGVDDREMIETGGETGDWEHDRRAVSRAEIIGIMRPRVEEILEAAAERLEAAGFGALPAQRIVLTGGGSQIPGLDGLAARILGQQVRLGRPLRVPGLPQAASGAAFSASVGLSLFAANPQDEWWDFEMPAELHTGSLRRAVRWFRDNW